MRERWLRGRWLRGCGRAAAPPDAHHGLAVAVREELLHLQHRWGRCAYEEGVRMYCLILVWRGWSTFLMWACLQHHRQVEQRGVARHVRRLGEHLPGLGRCGAIRLKDGTTMKPS